MAIYSSSGLSIKSRHKDTPTIFWDCFSRSKKLIGSLE